MTERLLITVVICHAIIGAIVIICAVSLAASGAIDADAVVAILAGGGGYAAGSATTLGGAQLLARNGYTGNGR